MTVLDESITIYQDKMRLDKFLKVSRLIKRRTVANEACDAGRVLVNGKVAKASVNVKPGDIIEIMHEALIHMWICLSWNGTGYVSDIVVSGENGA